MTTTMAPICVACKHFQGWKSGSFGGTCDAYPGGIPRAILLNQRDHRKAAPGDHGIHFAPKSRADANYPNIVFSGAHGAASPMSETITAPEQE